MDKRLIELMQHYRNAFLSPSGKEVLIDLMKKGYFLNSGAGEITIDMPEALGKRNFVNYIVSMLGCSDNAELNFRAIVDSFVGMPITVKPERKKEDYL